MVYGYTGDETLRISVRLALSAFEKHITFLASYPPFVCTHVRYPRGMHSHAVQSSPACTLSREGHSLYDLQPDTPG